MFELMDSNHHQLFIKRMTIHTRIQIHTLTLLFCLLLALPLASPWCLRTMANLTDSVNKVDYSADGQYIVVTSTPLNQVILYDTTNYFTIFTYTPSGNTANVARFSKDGLFIGVGLDNGDVELLSTSLPFSNTPAFTLQPNNNPVIDLDFNYNNNMILACYNGDSNIYIVDDYIGTQGTRNRDLGQDLIACRFGKDNAVAVIDNNRYAYIFTIPASSVSIPIYTTRVRASGNDFTDIALRPTTTSVRAVASGGSNSQVGSSYFLNDGSSSQTDNIFTATPASIMNTACYSGDALYYAVAGNDKSIWIFDDATNTETAVLSDGMNDILTCAISPDGETLVAGTRLLNGQAFVYVYMRTCFFCSPGFYKTGTTSCQSCSLAMVSCSICLNSTLCTACFQGYYLQANSANTTCISCYSVMEGCSTCQSSSVCIQCNQGYQLNGSTCSPCNIQHTGCLACNSSDCFLCGLDYYLVGTTCNRCRDAMVGCQRCSSVSNCYDCLQGYYVSGGGTGCGACASQCILCHALSNNCTVCTRGFYLSGNTCTTCSANCLECTSAAVCRDCAQGFYFSGAACTRCSLPCATCTTNIDCLSCSIGHYLASTTCLPCNFNCSLCTSPTNCSSCNVGYYLSATSQCLACGWQYPGCTQCQLGGCGACDQTRYLASATSCVVCDVVMPGCQFCSSATDCTVCGVGYYPTGMNNASACSVCSIQCQVCESDTACLACVLGYWLSGSTCTACSSPCVTCLFDVGSAAEGCLSCEVGYYLNGTVCQPCTKVDNCLVCQGETTCIDCLEGFYVDGGNCTACPSGCFQCNNTNCLSCNIGYYPSDPLSCSPCQSNCSTCSTSNDCNSCTLGYYFDPSLLTNQCLSCTQHDTACLTCSNSSCFSCSSGHYLDAGSCYPCSTNVTDCSLCQSALVCTLCQDGFTLDSPTTCLSCNSLPGCLSCSNSTLCTLCASGYFSDAGSCSPCASNCSSCISATSCTVCASSYYTSGVECPSCQDQLMGCQFCSDNLTCLSCEGGYLLSSNSTCQPCSNSIPACSLCDTSSCHSCQQGYFLNSTSSCQLCSSSASLSGCLLCNSSSTCQYCTGGYYLSSDSCHLCSPSLSGCEQCENSSICLDCSSGYYLNADSNGCQLCQVSLSGCIFCSDNTSCLQCQGGYYLANATCAPCDQHGCEICNATDPTLCVTCNSGYYLNNHTCSFCPQVGCLACDSTACLSCQVGYFLDNNTCTLCSTSILGCSKCSSASVCTECESLFHLDTGNCSICSSSMIGCSFCVSSSVCLACDGGYFLNGSVCNPCSNITGCLICNGSSSCLTCNSGYFIVNSTCSQCSSSISNCFQCYNGSICAACENGYQKTTIGGCEVMQLSGSGGGAAASGPAELAFTTNYLNSSTLRHALSVVDRSATFSNIGSEDWPAVAAISLVNKEGSIPLTVLSVELSSDLSTLFFYTNNPSTITTEHMPVTNKGRILAGQSSRLLAGKSMQQLTMQASLSLPKSVINNVLPSVLISEDLVMSYDLDDTSFYVTFVKESYSLYFFLFGACFIGLLFLYGFCRATCLSLYSRNLEIVGHVLALKTISLVVYPTYAEYVNFCLGFMVVDFPWLNSLLPAVFANQFDIAPTGYFFYFRNMNFAAMHFFTLLLVLTMLALGYFLLKDSKSSEVELKDKGKTVLNFKFQAFKQFILNFFGFGLTFAGFSSVIGAFLNYSSSLSLNGIFYILGVVVYGAMFSQAISCLIFNRRLCRLRIVLKATFLAGASLNPLYLSAVAMIVDGILLGIEYKMRKNHLVCPKSWLASNVLILSALVCYFFIPDSYLTLGVVVTLIALTYIFEFYIFCCERELGEAKNFKLFQQEQNIVSESLFLNLQQSHASDTDLSEKESHKSPAKEKEKDKEFVFEVSNLDESIANTTIASKYSGNPFEPKRRTRKFKSPQLNPQVTGDSWHIPTNQKVETIVLEDYES